MNQSNKKLIKVTILDHNEFITNVIEDILNSYEHELTKVKSLSEVKPPYDYLIFYEDSINEELINEFELLPKGIGSKIIIATKYKIPQEIIPFLNTIVQVQEIDERLKDIFDYYLYLHSEKSYKEEVDMINKLVKETQEYADAIEMYLGLLKNSIKQSTDKNLHLFDEMERLLKIFREEFTSFENINFVDKIKMTYENINILIQNVFREKEEELKRKTPNLVLDLNYDLPLLKINKVVFSKLIRNLIEIILASAQEIKCITVRTKKLDRSYLVEIEIECKKFDSVLVIQAFNPFFPRRVLHDVIVKYFRNKVEEFHRIYLTSIFVNNKQIFTIIFEV